MLTAICETEIILNKTKKIKLLGNIRSKKKIEVDSLVGRHTMNPVVKWASPDGYIIFFLKLSALIFLPTS